MQQMAPNYVTTNIRDQYGASDVHGNLQKADIAAVDAITKLYEDFQKEEADAADQRSETIKFLEHGASILPTV
jgi:hypothetical protein